MQSATTTYLAGMYRYLYGARSFLIAAQVNCSYAHALTVTKTMQMFSQKVKKKLCENGQTVVVVNIGTGVILMKL